MENEDELDVVLANEMTGLVPAKPETEAEEETEKSLATGTKKKEK